MRFSSFQCITRPRRPRQGVLLFTLAWEKDRVLHPPCSDPQLTRPKPEIPRPLYHQSQPRSQTAHGALSQSQKRNLRQRSQISHDDNFRLQGNKSPTRETSKTRHLSCFGQSLPWNLRPGQKPSSRLRSSHPLMLFHTYDHNQAHQKSGQIRRTSVECVFLEHALERSVLWSRFAPHDETSRRKR